MKKFVFLAGIAAAVFGAMKMLRSKDENSFDVDAPYEPQPQPQI
ncbi:MAG: hypothetical protein WEB52_05135 [Dehalococcoidia bacterium]